MKSIVLGIIILSSQCVFAQNLVFVFLHHRSDIAEPPKEQLDKIMEGHMANIHNMAKEGKLLVAGPFEGGGGIFIFNSSSIEQVKQWLSNDPGVQANRWNVELQLYYSHTGKPQLMNEPYEMTTYNFVRFVPYVAKFNINDVPELLKKHDDYVKEIGKTGNVVAEGSFGETEGGILLIKGDLNKAVIESDPAVHGGLLEPEIKKLYIARGAFGEK
jgi:uncharacterized protein YciI